MLAETRDRGAFKKHRAVLDSAADGIAAFPQVHREIEDCGAALYVGRAVVLRTGIRIPGVLQREADLKQRIPAEVAFRLEHLHQPLERNVLVRVRVQRDAPDAVNDRAETRASRKIRPQHESVHEKSDERFQLLARPVGNRRPDHYVVLARISEQQNIEGREQSHEQRRALCRRQPAQSGGDSGRQREAVESAAEIGSDRARAVRNQGHRRQPGKLRAPVRHLRLEPLTAQPLPLPDREIGVLDRQFGERRSTARGEGRVQRPQFAR